MSPNFYNRNDDAYRLLYDLSAMATLQIHLRDDLQQRIATRAAESGYKTIDEYLEALICADFGEDEVVAELERVLLEPVNDRSRIELTPEFIKQFDDRIANRRRSSGNQG